MRKERSPAPVIEESKPAPLVVVPEPPAKPARKARTPAAPKTVTPKKAPTPRAKAPDAAAFQALVQEVARLSEALAARPTWSDLKELEARLQSVQPALSGDEAESLRELLRTREEELEELGLVVSEFQEQNEKAFSQIQELNQRLLEAQAHSVESETRAQMAEGFLREALLSLLAPGDEFNEDLVEQIQHFLQP
ncbi:MAG: hypothetical protein J0I12_18780 [Candidatus Eremiobacteraeota bacterium]|nr:hypothetical protein [Candidatus Eremiobacteraeota bacterium]